MSNPLNTWHVFNDDNTTNSQSITLTPAGGSGHHLILVLGVLYNHPTGSIASVVDTVNAPAGWTKDADSGTFADNNYGAQLAVFRVENVNGTATTITATVNDSGSGAWFCLAVFEISGMATSAFDVGAGANRTTQGTSLAVAASSAQSGDFVVSGIVDCYNDAVTYSPSAGWTVGPRDTTGDSFASAYQTAVSAGAPSCTWSWSGNQEPVAAIAAYLAAGGGGAIDPLPLVYTQFRAVNGNAVYRT